MQTTRESIVADLFHWSIDLAVSVPCVKQALSQMISANIYVRVPCAIRRDGVLQGATGCYERSYIGVMPSEVFHIQYFTYIVKVVFETRRAFD
jgi:predicted small integral membrane protein